MKLTKAFFEDIRELILSARATVAYGVDMVQVYTNFEIGRRIVEEELRGEDRAAYGKAVMKALSERLTDEFGKGFSHTNLKLMRLFYLQNKHRISQTASDQSSLLQSATAKAALTPKARMASGQSTIFQTTTGKFGTVSKRVFTLSWSHYVFLLGIKNSEERSFYEIEATSQNWALRELKRQFNSSLYERLALSRNKKGVRRLAREGQIVSQPKDLLKEPLVLEFLGLNEQARHSESDLETAIILCKKKNETLVEITLPKDANIHAREYQLYLPSKEELQRKLVEWAGEADDE